MAARDELAKKLEELRKLAAGSRRKLTEIATGITRLRGEIKEVGALLGNHAPVEPEEAEREFEEVEPTRARISRHDA